MKEINEIQDNSLDATHSSHNIEHLYPHEFILFFKEFKKKLKSSGFT